MDTGYFPDTWSDGYIVPIHKKGNLSDVNNFRGITLLSTLGKLFTRILNTRLTNWAEEYYIYIEAQAGFRANMSTTDNIFVLHGLINHMLNTGSRLYCGFVDFSKAFDYVVRDVIWYKLIKLGVRGKILNVIKSMYNNVRSKVRHQNQLSEGFECYLGVRQGESLSPFLFAMYLNDLEDEYFVKGAEGIDIGMLKLFILLYADDIIIFAKTAEELQLSLDILDTYCKRWKLKVNINKTKIMVFRKGGILRRNLNFFYNGDTLEIVTKFTYLGIVFTTGGSFSDAQVTLSGQAQKAIYKLKRHLLKFENLSIEHKFELFDKLITPILNYGSEVWGFSQAKNIERVHLQFAKSLLCVKNTCQNDFIYGELGRISYKTRRIFIIIKYWLKLLNVSERKYNHIVYKMMLNDIELMPTKTNWASLVRNELFNLGFNEVWYQQSAGDNKFFLTILRQRLKDVFVQNWNERLNLSSRATFYRSFAEFKFQPYLNIVNVSKFRIALTQLRVSSHRLEIETGRWTKPNKISRENRKCQVCSILEDEFHFLFECYLYKDLRKQYIKPYFTRHCSMLKTIQLFKSEKKRDIQNLAMFIFKAFELRKSIILKQQ